MNNNLKYKCALVYKFYLYCHDCGVTWLMLHDSYIMMRVTPGESGVVAL